MRKIRRRLTRGGGAAYSGPLLAWANAVFTRPIEGSYQSDVGGTMAFAAINARREGYDFGELLTLLESQRTNYNIRSEDFSGWGASLVTVTPNVTTAPDGAADGASLAYTANTGARVTMAAAIAASTRMTLSRWVKNSSGNGLTRLQLIQRDGATEVSLNSTATADWAREVLRGADVGAGGSNPQFWQRAGADGLLKTIFSWGTQWEIGRYETSYVRTANGAIERDADQATWAPEEVPLLLRAAPWRMRAASWHANTDLVSGDIRVIASFVGPDDVLRVRHNGTAVVLEALVGGVVKATQTVTYARKTAVDIWVDPVGGRVGFAGVWGAAGTPWAWPTGHFRLGGEVGGVNEWDGGLGLPETL